MHIFDTPSLRASTIATTVVLVVGLMSGPVLANELWKEHGDDCDETAFANPGGVKLEKLDSCTRLWFAYKPQGQVTGTYGDSVKEAVRRLYVEGSDAQAHLSRQVLNGLRVDSLPKRAPKGPSSIVAEEEREKCDVPRPGKKAIRAAKKSFKKGMKSYKQEDYEGALEHFLKMVEVAPGWAKGHYNSAAMYAKLDDEPNMVKHLYCLQDIGNTESSKALRSARTDVDFASIRRKSAAFKSITGYARIKIGNSLGEYGEDNVDNLEGMLVALGYPSPTLTETDKPYTEPHIWYRAEVRTSAFLLLKVMAHPKTRAHVIDWDEKDYDIIVAWGDRIKPGADPKLYVSDPEESGDTIADLERAHDDALRKPDEFAAEVDSTLNKPQEAMDDVNDRVDRTTGAANKLKNTTKKVINYRGPSL